MAVINPGCRQSSEIPADYTVWGLDDSSFQTLMTIGQVDASAFNYPFHAISPGAAFAQRCVAAPPNPDGSVVSQCTQQPSSFDPVTFDNICTEDGFWTAADGEYALSTNYGPGTGMSFEYNAQPNATDQKKIYDGFSAIHAERWNPETVYYMGAMRWVAGAAAYLKKNPSVQSGPSVEQAGAEVVRLEGELAASGKRLEAYRANPDAFAAQIKPEETNHNALEEQLGAARQALATAQSAGDPAAAGQYLDAVKAFFVGHFQDAMCVPEDGIEILFSGIAPIDVDETVFESAMKAIAPQLQGCMIHGQAEFVNLLRMIYKYNKAAAKVAEAEKALESNPPDISTAQTAMSAATGLIHGINVGTIALWQLDPRQQMLVPMLGFKMMQLEGRMGALQAKIAPCTTRQIRNISGACEPCASGLVPKAPVAPATESTVCEATAESCATISQVPADDGLSCKPCEEGKVFKDAAEGCVEKPKPVVRRAKPKGQGGSGGPAKKQEKPKGGGLSIPNTW